MRKLAHPAQESSPALACPRRFNAIKAKSTTTDVVSRVDFLTPPDNQMTVFSCEIAYVSAVVNHAQALAEIKLAVGEKL